MAFIDLIADNPGSYRSLIISINEVALREGINLQKGMNFRDNESQCAVFLVLDQEGFHDTWDIGRSLFIYQGHDSTAEGAAGSNDDQLLMYASGKPTENGKFFKAANAYKDGLRDSPLQIQVYEKLDPGVFFDKGIFNLVDAKYEKVVSRRVAAFYLSPADVTDHEVSWNERMIDPALKADVWKQSRGRCIVCAGESQMHFVRDSEQSLQLMCSLHRSLKVRE
jgi:hypothetical protein